MEAPVSITWFFVHISIVFPTLRKSFTSISAGMGEA
jgi:hypothetical protein